jgi:hypothetical protein
MPLAESHHQGHFGDGTSLASTHAIIVMLKGLSPSLGLPCLVLVARLTEQIHGVARLNDLLTKTDHRGVGNRLKTANRKLDENELSPITLKDVKAAAPFKPALSKLP